MWNIKEEDLDEFRMTCNNRLSPEGATALCLERCFCFNMMFFLYRCFISFGWDYLLALFDKTIVC